uniref:Uncharacterized protein n=1 Tax=Rhizophora mucronata TaxID=61149 RepID=A0A2P2NBI2_RHIMU
MCFTYAKGCAFA